MKTITHEQADNHLIEVSTNGKHLETLGTSRIKTISYSYLDCRFDYFFIDDILVKIETFNGFSLNEYYVR